MKRNHEVYVAFLCLWLIAGSPFESMAAGPPSPPSELTIGGSAPIPPPPPVPPPPVTPPGNDGLLSGMTPGNYKTPSGWILVRATDFEGPQPSGETWELWGAGVQTDRYHSGAKSLGGTYGSDQSDIAWRLSGTVVGTYTEIYLSFYEYIESQALFNDEFFLARFAVNSPTFQEVLVDWYWARQTVGGPLSFNGPVATLYVVPQGNRTTRVAGKTATVPKGTWVQWEIHYRPNTAGVSNGFMRIYKDGHLFTSVENANLNGTLSMTNSSVHVGGVYTKLVWMKDHPTCSVPSGCSSAPGNGTDLCTAAKKWSGQKFSSPVCTPVDPPLKSFKRYFDDILLMKK